MLPGHYRKRIRFFWQPQDSWGADFLRSLTLPARREIRSLRLPARREKTTTPPWWGGFVRKHLWQDQAELFCLFHIDLARRDVHLAFYGGYHAGHGGFLLAVRRGAVVSLLFPLVLEVIINGLSLFLYLQDVGALVGFLEGAFAAHKCALESDFLALLFPGIDGASHDQQAGDDHHQARSDFSHRSSSYGEIGCGPPHWGKLYAKIQGRGVYHPFFSGIDLSHASGPSTGRGGTGSNAGTALEIQLQNAIRVFVLTDHPQHPVQQALRGAN